MTILGFSVFRLADGPLQKCDFEIGSVIELSKQSQIKLFDILESKLT